MNTTLSDKQGTDCSSVSVIPRLSTLNTNKDKMQDSYIESLEGEE